jgi:CPA2 family monovalent cation:H+ antiporter-2
MISLSLALGAFVAGLLLGNSDFVHKLEKQTLPLRDAFVALFFVTIGMLIDPKTWFSSWHLVAILACLILVGKFLVWSGIVRAFGYPWDTARRVGIGLTQIGEFSFILAQSCSTPASSLAKSTTPRWWFRWLRFWPTPRFSNS